MPARVSPTDRVRAKIDELFASDRELPEILEEVARLGAQLLMQAALEAEVTEFLGRDRYQRTATAPDARSGSRNGYRPVTVKTTAGPVTLERPKLRGTTAAFASRLFGKHVTKTNALESLVIASFVRGLSVRDVEATLADALGDQAAISKSTVSQVCQAIKTEYDTWARRPLDDVVLDYLFLDASFFRMHPGSPAEPILAAWGITTAGKPIFVGLAPGVVESTDAWANFLTDLTDRGLACPLLVVSDGARGLIAAIEQIFPTALRQRCLIHRLRNVLAKIPAGMQAEIRDGYWACSTPRTRKPSPARGWSSWSTPGWPRSLPVTPNLPGSDEDPADRSRGPNRLSAVPGRTSSPHPALELHRTHLRRNSPPRKGYRPLPWRNQLHQHRVGRARPRIPRLARTHQHPRRTAQATRPAPQPATTTQQLRPRHTPDSAGSATETVSATA